MAVTGKRWKKNPTNHEKNKFLLGGNFRDPLNLNSLSDEKVNKILLHLYNKCVVAAASILSQILELQGFFKRGRKRQRVRQIMKDRQRQRVRKIMRQRERDRQTERERKIKRE
jgi:hypothetical protein